MPASEGAGETETGRFAAASNPAVATGRGVTCAEGSAIQAAAEQAPDQVGIELGRQSGRPARRDTKKSSLVVNTDIADMCAFNLNMI